VVLAGAALIPLALLAGCSSTAATPKPSGTSSTTAKDPRDAQTYRFQFGVNDPDGEWDTIAFQQWADNVAKDTNNHVIISVVTNGALGANSTQLAALQKGSQFGYTMSEGDVEGLDPLFTIPDLPYVFPKGTAQAKTILNGEFGDQLNAAAEKNGVQCVGWITYGPRDIMSKTPVKTPADLKGLKLRVQPSKTMESGYQKLGADINPIAYNEVYSALSTGVVSAMENAPTQLYAKQIYQVADNLTQLDMIYSVGCLLVSKSLFDTLPPDYQKIIQKDGAAAASVEFDGFETANAQAVDAMKSKGVHVYQANAAAWKAAVGNTAADFAKSEGATTYAAYKKILADEAK
jgi:tripartite ATP-independent transporter DctP family solute receptor